MVRPRDRQLKIIDILRREGRVSVDKLVASFESSPETIRRDLKKLSRGGRLLKVHGGAMLPGALGEGSYQQRMTENVTAKREIAEKARQLILPGDTLFLDTGSTTLIFAEEIANIKNLTVITNSIEIAKVVSGGKKTSKVFLLGGEYFKANRQTIGAMVLAQLQYFQAQHVVLTVGGINASAGAVGFDIGEVSLASAMLARAGNSILLVDASKFNRIAPFVVGALDKFDQLVCESMPEGVLKAALIQNDIDIVC